MAEQSTMNQTERNVPVEEEEEEDFEFGNEEFWPLSENKPFFNVILSKSQVKPSCNLVIFNLTVIPYTSMFQYKDYFC